MNNENILEVKDLEVKFPILGGILKKKLATVKALDKISYSFKRSTITGIVGESGSGKTTLGKALIKILKFTAPEVEIDGQIDLFLKQDKKVEINSLSNKEFLPYRKDIQMVFQDPYSSLNPRMITRDIIRESMDIHMKNLTVKDKNDRVSFLMEKVGLSKDHAYRYPHEFSGGQRQRIVIARALSTNPDIVIADEPVSALDVSIQAQVINLMKDIQKEFKLTLIFIAHDLSVVEHISDYILVMYLGDIVEYGSREDVCEFPKHPYTRSLISSIPIADPFADTKNRIKLKGEIPSPINKPSGCPFRLRCKIAKPDCALQKPELKEISGGHFCACPFSNDWDSLIHG